MVFEEPKAELVEIEQENVVTASGGSSETCNGSNAAMNNCSTMTTTGFMNG